ncbi:MAG TPA: hypothetical protein PKA64_18310 [Myxococcota bacterium]|nr:hypothetical protein [Myxococcota bacterium]
MRTILFTLLLTGCYDGSDYSDGSWNDPVWGGSWGNPPALSTTSDRLVERSSVAVDASGAVAVQSPAGARRETGAYVGMSTMVCQVLWRSGMISADYNPDANETEVVTDYDEDVVLSVTPRGYQVLTPDIGDTQHFRRPGLVDARIGDRGPILVIEDPGSCTVDVGGRNPVELPGACPTGGSFTVDADDMTAWSGSAGGVVEIDRDGARPFGATGDLVARDADHDILYVASTGGAEVRGYDRERNLLWTAPIDGAVRELRAIPARAMAALLVDRAEGSAIVYVAADDGAVTEAGSVRTAVDHLTTSPDGSRLALALRGEVHFFDDCAEGTTAEGRCR